MYRSFKLYEQRLGSPQTTNAYGNNSITESNVVTIASLKTTYASAISATQNSYQLIEDNIQIKGRITGNDIEGNIFNNVAIEDGSGSILIGIAQGGLFGYPSCWTRNHCQPKRFVYW